MGRTSGNPGHGWLGWLGWLAGLAGWLVGWLAGWQRLCGLLLFSQLEASTAWLRQRTARRRGLRRFFVMCSNMERWEYWAKVLNRLFYLF